MTHRETISEVFDRLVAAPAQVDCTVDQVLIACGQFVAAILAEAYSDLTARQGKADWFCQGLQLSVNRTKAAELKLN